MDSAPLIGDEHVIRWRAIWFPGHRLVPMPRGGFRALALCPTCDRWCTHLYSFSMMGPDRCRHCWGLRYPSQYQGRRPEATRERLYALGDWGWRSRSPVARVRRLIRLNQAIDLYNTKDLAHAQRALAATEAFCARIEAWLRRRESRNTNRKHAHEVGSLASVQIGDTVFYRRASGEFGMPPIHTGTQGDASGLVPDFVILSRGG